MVATKGYITNRAKGSILTLYCERVPRAPVFGGQGGSMILQEQEQ